ncbi:MAG: DUF2334 domain-containing protein [Ignavibacteriales bacterium]|nr:DUF2334 domain-containing protein [Ignavibacteriales bacterium]
MIRFVVSVLIVLLSIIVHSPSAVAQTSAQKSVLILIDGNTDMKNYAMADGRQLASLLGHFNVRYKLKGVNEYLPGEMKQYDFTFYVGFDVHTILPEKFTQDVFTLDSRVFWLNSGFADFSRKFPVEKRFGFSVSGPDSLSGFDLVRFGSTSFQKGEPFINIAAVTNRKLVTVTATAFSSRLKREIPYIITSGNLTYIADMPFASAGPADRYILFADMLHDFLGENHEESHSALIRIEDVGPFDNPDHLREIADILSAKGVPFLVGVIPFFVDPGKNIRVSLSDKPDLVDALKYMVHNGATIVMHGSTHQYKGVTAADFEFWDESLMKPIAKQTAEEIAQKLESGIQEFMKNGLYPLVWETPHYTGSFTLYQTVAKYFSTAMEQRLSFEDFDCSQSFPYVINSDWFGQRIYPENLGYVPLNPDKAVSDTYIQDILRNAKANLNVRDGFASCFFHSFLDLDLLRELVDGVQALGYTYMDLSDQPNWVKTKDRVILSGSQSYQITLKDQYLAEGYFDSEGEIVRRVFSDNRINGVIARQIELNPGEIYKAEPIEFRARDMGFVDKVVSRAKRMFTNAFVGEPDWREARVAILWNHHIRGASFNDQASLASVFRSVHINVDTIFIGQELRLQDYNLVIVPFAFVDSLKSGDYGTLVGYVQQGGSLITDQKNELAEELGIHFAQSQMRLRNVRDRNYPEETVTWKQFESVYKLNVEDVDEVFCQDAATDAPVVIGKSVGKGKVIFFATRFDPLSQHGYSYYPYLLDYVKRYFRLGPIVRRENLEAYFDPGLRPTSSVEDLVKQWVRTGIRRIHVAGWHEYPKRDYVYDYGRLIQLAHANGILVYAWLEPPQISQQFWRDHPEWREKNYKGEDAQPAWRYAVALTEPACVDSIAMKFKKLLEGFDFDGVNLAELYFESGRGFETPLQFAPMHPSAVREVKKKYGIELTSIFDPNSPWFWKTNPAVQTTLTEYRIGKLDEVYERLLRDFSDVAARRPGFQIIVTAMDSYGAPEVRENLGVDMNHILALQKRFGFLLQVEDAERLWSTDPLRYVEIGRRYARLMNDSSKLMLDLNILDLSSSTRKKGALTPFPTTIQTGTESFLLVQAAAIGAPRFTFYAEETVNGQDLPFFANASAHGITYQRINDGYSIEAKHSFVLRLPKEIPQILIDDMFVQSSRENLFFVPAGSHRVNVNPAASGAFSTSQLQPRLLSSTADISALSYGMRNARFTYESDERMLVSFSNEPTQVLLDGQPYTFTLMKGSDCYTIQLPSGKHEVDVITGNSFSYGVNVTSLWSSTAIAMFGFLAVVLLAGMYITLKILHRRTKT